MVLAPDASRLARLLPVSRGMTATRCSSSSLPLAGAAMAPVQWWVDNLP
eukprot:COSAG01_NODE_1694_length_9467_cov_4.976196_7_plen_49_part_00